jgi:hypothetical protein
MFEGNLLKELLDELIVFSALKTKEVEFIPIEPYLKFTLSLNSRKKVEVKGTVTNANSECWATLEYQFETDLTYIDVFINGLKNILEKYPPRK